ncbi:MAG: GNAT family N-acetyltransferase [Candidatus Pacearchaeota archaeon]
MKEQIGLRKLRISDDKRLLSLFADKKVLRNLDTNSKPDEITLSQERVFLKESIKNYRSKKPTKYDLGIIAGNELIGVIGTPRGIDYENLNVEIGYWIGEEYWGQGITTEAVRLFTRLLFDKFKLVRIFACPYTNNRASQKVLEKNGYVMEGVRRKVFRKGNKFYDDVIYARVR